MSDRPCTGNYTCPVCGYLSFDAEPGSYEICPICFWEDELELFDPFYFVGGPNGVSLLEAQRNFLEFGASESRRLERVRKPTAEDRKDPTWRRVDPRIDVFDGRWEFLRDWRDFPADKTTLYYWRDNYYLRGKKPTIAWGPPVYRLSRLELGKLKIFRGSKVHRPSSALFPCPCCGYLIFSEPRPFIEGDICPICFWHYDPASLLDPFHFTGNGNRVCLIEAQRNFAEFGASDWKRRQFVRQSTETEMRDPLWRRVEPAIDVFDSREEFKEFRGDWATDPARLYYWRENYWLLGRKQPLDW